MKLINNLVLLFLFLMTVIYVLVESLYSPYHNWDMIMYIASAKSYEESDIGSLHTFTYETLKKSVSQQEYANLIAGEFRDTIYKDVSAFKEMLPFYQIRPFYTGAIYLLYKSGVDIAFATHVISGISVVTALFLIYLLSITFLKTSFAYAIPVLVFAFGVPDLAKFSTPDGMAFFAVVLISYLYLKQRFLILISVSPILLCIRTDLILFTVPLLFFILAQSNKLRSKTIISIIFSMCLYIAIGAYWDNPGWTTIFYFTLVEISTHPISAPSSLTTHHYIEVVTRGLINLLNNHKFLLYISVFICSFSMIIKGSKQQSLRFLNSPPAILSIVCFSFIISHFILFPVAWDRFFSGTYLLGFFSWLIMVAKYLDTPASSCNV